MTIFGCMRAERASENITNESESSEFSRREIRQEVAVCNSIANVAELDTDTGLS